LSRLGADILSTAIPIEAQHGVTSTAVGWPDDPWNRRRRLTLWELYEKLPETFCIRDLIEVGLAEVGQCLLINTGCWLLDLRKPWITGTDEAGNLRCFFTIQDRIRRQANGEWGPEVISEDWNFSRMVAREGGTLWATRKLIVQHMRDLPISNEKPWGDWKTDQVWEEKISGQANGRSDQ